MTHIEINKGQSLAIYVTDIVMVDDNGNEYNLSSVDMFRFSLKECTNSKREILNKWLDNGIMLVNNELVITLSPEDTIDLQPLAYTFDITIDLENKGEQIYSIASGIMAIKDG